jgi:hypothetical protein
VTKRALWREFVGVTWHLPTMTWPQFLDLSIGDRFLLLDELNQMIDRHNEEAGIPRDRH